MSSFIDIGLLAILFGSVSIILGDEICPKNFVLPPVPLWYSPSLCIEAVCQCMDTRQSSSYEAVCSVDCACNHGKDESHCDFVHHVCICEGGNLTDPGYCVENKLAINAIMEFTLGLLQDNKDPSDAIDSLLYATQNTISSLDYVKYIICSFTQLISPLYYNLVYHLFC